MSIDLIYGTPTLSNEQWKQNVDKAISLGVPHLSCYAMTVEPKTALHKMIETKKMPDVSEDKQSLHFELLCKWVREAGYEHYEISNFAKPGYRSKHNSSYWKSEPYLGLGPSAHSFNGRERRWNLANNQQYIAGIQSFTPSRESEELTNEQKLKPKP